MKPLRVRHTLRNLVCAIRNTIYEANFYLIIIFFILNRSGGAEGSTCIIQSICLMDEEKPRMQKLFTTRPM